MTSLSPPVACIIVSMSGTARALSFLKKRLWVPLGFCMFFTASSTPALQFAVGRSSRNRSGVVLTNPSGLIVALHSKENGSSLGLE